jgi:phosphoribosyl 1,2-cyclic phosphodiesterase
MIAFFMQVKLWGVRGSLPAPLAPEQVRRQTRALLHESTSLGLKSTSEVDQFLKNQPAWRYGGFGGNTSCIEVTTKQANVIFDAGTGLRALGHELTLSGIDTREREFHIFFTHFHWDHLIGLCFFMPIFIPGNTVHFYAVQPELESVIRTLFKKPYFPVPFEALGAKLTFHSLKPRESKTIGDLEITPYQLDHPDPCWGYKVRGDGKTFSLCVDTECTRVSAEALGPDLPLYQGVDAMIFDAQYTLAEAAHRVTWGHAAATIGLDIAMREGIKQIYFAHHDPSHTDKAIADSEDQAREYYESHLKNERRAKRVVNEVQWAFAREGMVIDL